MAIYTGRFNTSYYDAKAKAKYHDTIGKSFIFKSQTCNLRQNRLLHALRRSKQWRVHRLLPPQHRPSTVVSWGVPPMATLTISILMHYLELEALDDVDNSIGVVEVYLYATCCSSSQS